MLYFVAAHVHDHNRMYTTLLYVRVHDIMQVAAFTREQRFFSVGFCMGLLFSLSQAVMPWRIC